MSLGPLTCAAVFEQVAVATSPKLRSKKPGSTDDQMLSERTQFEERNQISLTPKLCELI